MLWIECEFYLWEETQESHEFLNTFFFNNIIDFFIYSVLRNMKSSLVFKFFLSLKLLYKQFYTQLNFELRNKTLENILIFILLFMYSIYNFSFCSWIFQNLFSIWTYILFSNILFKRIFFKVFFLKYQNILEFLIQKYTYFISSFKKKKLIF